MNEPTPPAIFVVEDHPLVRLGIEALISQRYRYAGSADNAASAIEMIRDRKPDLVLLDVHIEGGGGAAVVDAVRKTDPSVRFLVVSVSTAPQDVLTMFRAGVEGYVVKTADAGFMFEAIGRVLGGASAVSPEVAGYLLDIDGFTRDLRGVERLTPREREVTTLIARGYSYRESAAELGMSVKTLENHIGNIFRKVHVTSRNELTRYVYETGWLRPDSVGLAAPELATSDVGGAGRG
ncbi:MAG TPA: response regulator transcription factor [Acidimicrobiia bacterium]|nr:response regulator transcription factor [Acidimicrobiia bacterium]